MVPTNELLKYVIAELSERGYDTTKTALVKFLYLADVEALRMGEPRISNLKWVYYKYGPYAFEIEEALRQVAGRDIDELAKLSTLGRPYYLYRSGGHQEEPRIPPEQRGIVNSVLDRWGAESLDRILNYVYFETEPMQDAQWGQPLNLDLVQRRERPMNLADFLASRVTPQDAEQLAQLKREFWSKALARQKEHVEPSPRPRYDDVLLTGLKATDENDKWS